MLKLIISPASAICTVLPVAARTPARNCSALLLPSERWIRTIINPYSSYLEEEESGGNTSSGPAFPVLANYAPAFPGAVGYGRNADGARGSNNREIYVVTNLNNSGAGSLRDAVSQANRIIVFNVSGVIDLNKEVLVFKDNQTVLFQTAPGDGIELYNGRTSSTNAQ